MCLTHFVSGGSSMDGSTRVSSSRIVSARAGSRCTLRTALTRFPGALLNCWPSHWSSRSEERRVGKECRSRWWPDHLKKKRNYWRRIRLLKRSSIDKKRENRKKCNEAQCRVVSET